MNIKEILDIKTIKIGLELKTKDEVINKLSEILYENGYITNLEEYKKDIYEREKIGQTGIGNFIAIPHGKSSSVKKIGVAIGVVKEEIEWETVDNNGVKVIILFAVGNDTEGANNHLKMLSLFARKLGNDETVENLLKAKKIEDVIEAFN